MFIVPCASQENDISDLNELSKLAGVSRVGATRLPRAYGVRQLAEACPADACWRWPCGYQCSKLTTLFLRDYESSKSNPGERATRRMMTEDGARSPHGARV